MESQKTIITPEIRKLETSDLLKNNLSIFVWLLFLTFGGGLLALYYARIGYFPGVDWETMLTYIAAASIIGGSVVVALAFLLFLPGLIWSQCLVCDSRLKNVLCYKELDDDEPSIMDIIKRLGVPFGANLVVSHIFLTFDETVYFIAASIVLFLVSVWTWYNFRKEIDTEHERERRVRLFKYIFWFDLSVILSQTALFLIYQIAAKPGGLTFYVLIGACTIIVFLSNHIVAARYWRYKPQAIGASVLAALLLLFATDRSAPLAERIMALYGFGGNQNVTLLVSKEGLRTVESLGLPPNNSDEDNRDKIRNVQILSSIGSEYFLQIDNMRFVLPKSMVISWITIDKDTSRDAEAISKLSSETLVD